REELDEELLEEILGLEEERAEECSDVRERLDLPGLQAEIDELRRLSRWARSIRTDAKARALLKALDIGFEQMKNLGARRKALIFTESRRTQEYLKAFLEANGYDGQI